jgi:hypothetical protein
LEGRLNNNGRPCIKKLKKTTRHRGLTPVMIATQEAQIRTLMDQTQPGQIVCKTFLKKTHCKKGWLAWPNKFTRPYLENT